MEITELLSFTEIKFFIGHIMNDDDIVAPGKSFSNVKTMNHAYFVINDAICD